MTSPSSRGFKIPDRVRDDNDTVVFTIDDNGPGISPQDLKRIFEPFYTTKETGTGLGLYVVRELIRRNSGDISVQSVKSQGTTFKLKFRGV